MGFLVRAITAGCFGLAALLAACGGGGGDDGGAGPQPPQVSSSPSSTVAIAPSGGSVSLESRVVATFSKDVLVSTGTVTASLVPSADSRAVSARDLRLTVPSSRLSSQRDATITFTLFADASTGQAGKQGSSDARAQAIDAATVWARIEVGTDRAVSMVLPVVRDAATGAYTAVMRGIQWTSAVLRGSPLDASDDVQFVVRLVAGVVVDDAIVPRKIYAWTGRDAPQPSPLEGAAPIRPGRLPLLLVHGIDGRPIGACGGSDFFASTWLQFAQRFFDDSELRTKYDLYTFAYPTTQGVGENGRKLAEKINEHFGNRPVVVLSHSMGGLLTRFADAHHSRKGLAERRLSEAGGYDIDIHGAITLNTPHRGVDASDDLAWISHLSCFDSRQGSLDLEWDAGLLRDLNGADYRPAHLKRYIAYGGSFDLGDAAAAVARRVYGPTPLGRLVLDAIAACTSPNETHPLEYCLARIFQVAGQELQPASARSGGDGVTLVKSQLLQVYDSSQGWRTLDGVFARFELIGNTDHSGIHDAPHIFTKIRDDLVWILSPPTATPPNGSFAGNTNIGVSAFNAQRIYCTVRTTLDGSEPADPPEPTEASNDPCGLTSPNHIEGTEANFVLVAPPSGSKRVKVRFRAWTNGKLGPASNSYEFQVGSTTVEHGDTPTSATPVAIGSATAGALERPGDVDYLRFTVSTRATYAFFTTGSTNTRGTLYNGAYTFISSNDTSGEVDNFRFTATLDPGIYYIAVDGSFQTVTGGYLLHIEGPGAGTTSDDHGASPWSATPVAIGSVTAGTLRLTGDVDYFRFTVATRATYAFFTTGSTNTRGTLYSGTYAFISSNDTSGEVDNFRFTATLDPGTYYIAVEGSFQAVTGGYALHIEGPGAGTASDDHGASPWSATPVALGSATEGTLQLTGDVDYFRFTVATRATYAFFTTGSTNTRGTLYSGAYTFISSDDNSGEVNNFRFTATLDPGTYYIAVEGSFQTVTGGFLLHIEGPGAGTTSDDHGASPWSATQVAIGSATAGTLQLTGDVDYFRFSVATRATYAFFTTGGTNTRGTLYNSEYIFISGDDNTGEIDNFRLTATLDPGTYYIAVEGSFRTVTGEYTLHIEVP